jgi:hypothetical protein
VAKPKLIIEVRTNEYATRDVSPHAPRNAAIPMTRNSVVSKSLTAPPTTLWVPKTCRV